MCGIAGLISRTPQLALRELITRMSASIAHRGPDGEGFLISDGQRATPYSGNVPLAWDERYNYLPRESINGAGSGGHIAFAHRRLSIIDLSVAGHEPMSDATARLWITYNGEIYNYLELRDELAALGHVFRTATDTEVILCAYRQWGEHCVEHFNGMWGFCILDLDQQICFASRDRLGVKPFYYADRPSFFAFASEQKAFIRSGLMPLLMQEKALHNYLVNNALEMEPENFFGGITELFPGHNLVYHLRNHKITVTRYFDLGHIVNSGNDQLTEEELIAEAREKVRTAIALRLRSDVEVGTCLSGGIDSSVIAVTIASLKRSALHCFTASFPGQSFDETKFAKLVAEQVGAIHHLTEPTFQDLVRDLDDLVYSQDVPIWDTSTYAQHRVMGLAKRNNIKVVLDGQGADELFTGYLHHYTAKWNNLFSTGRVSALFKEMRAAGETLSSPASFYMKEKMKAAGYSPLPVASKFLKKDFVSAHAAMNPYRYQEDVNRQLVDDITRTRLKIFLKCEDRCGMWHGVESRTPFSDDIDLIRFMFSFDGNKKIRKGRLKYLLREAMRVDLPTRVYGRSDKKGFETPMLNWTREMKPRMIEEIRAARFPFVREEAIVLKQGTSASEKLLFRLFILARWKTLFTA